MGGLAGYALSATAASGRGNVGAEALLEVQSHNRAVV
jgi:hypothetical protein